MRSRSVATGYSLEMERERARIRPLGGGPGCLLMILVSVVASLVLTVLVNLLVR